MKLKRLQAISVLVIGISAVIKTAAGLSGVLLPDLAVRILGMFDLIAPSVFVFTSIKRKCIKDSCP